MSQVRSCTAIRVARAIEMQKSRAGRGDPSSRRPACEEDDSPVADLNPHDAGLSYFMEPVHRARFRNSLRYARLRAKLRAQLAHFPWLDQRYADGAVPLDIDRIAVCAVLWGDDGTLLSCIPGRLAFYCDEARQDMAILARPAPM